MGGARAPPAPPPGYATAHRHGHVLVLAAQKCLCRGPWISCNGPEWFKCFAVYRKYYQK